MSFFGPFVDKKGPVISAAFCNALDAIQNALQADQNGAIVSPAPTGPETNLMLNAVTGQLALALQGGTGMQIAAGVVGGGVNISQDPTGFALFNNLANQGFQFQGGDLLLSGPLTSTPSIGVTTSNAASQFALQLSNFGGQPLTYGVIQYGVLSVASVDPVGQWVFGPATGGGSGVGLNQTMNIVTAMNSFGLTVRPVHPIINGQSFGMLVAAGTNTGDLAFLVNSASNSASYFLVRGDGALYSLGPYGRSQSLSLTDMTPDRGTFIGTLSNMTSTVSGTFAFFRMGSTVTMYATGAITGTSNGAAMSLSGVPSSLWPANSQVVMIPVIVNSGLNQLGYIVCGPGNNFNVGAMGISGSVVVPSAIGASGTKGLTAGVSWTYSLV